MFEGDPVKLDGWLSQTQMYLCAYDVDLASSRAVEVAPYGARRRIGGQDNFI